ncbi:hypothetical protein [Abyssisolibacter fermentans]|uniref:hypothetical protein n=1 Tax=Abyssisolibacter fermentans TaxID=1766203 RepID=UPI0008325169|nr:hypothetical protein [Abyssisolibacter fermentans]
MKKIYIILILIIIVSLPACKSQKEEDKNTDKIPEQLKTITEGNEKIVENIEKIHDYLINPKKAEIDQDEMSKGKSEEEDSENKKEEKDGESGSEDEKKESENKSNEQQNTGTIKKDEEDGKETDLSQIIVKMWGEITSISKEIHGSWNEYEMESLKKGATEEDILKFETAINGLTIAIDNKDILDIMYKTNDVTMSLARFYDLYKDNIDGEKNRINYYIRGSYLYGFENDWETSLSQIQQANKQLEKLNNKIISDKKNSKYLKKLEISIKDMENVIPNKSRELLRIKRDIVLDNLDAIIQGEKKDEEE